MGYYLRLLTSSDATVPLGELQEAFAELDYDEITFALDADEGEGETELSWSFVRVYGEGGVLLCDVSRDLRGQGDLVEDEVTSFHEELAEAQPRNAARWVRDQLAAVKAIYAVQVMNVDDDDDGADVPSILVSLLQGYLGGLIQADGEGFSNEDGHLIVWQFDDETAEGVWTAAVLTPNGAWEAFEMDLADPAQREAFKQGRRPPNAVVLADEDDDEDED
jgi:hypothetical protein